MIPALASHMVTFLGLFLLLVLTFIPIGIARIVSDWRRERRRRRLWI